MNLLMPAQVLVHQLISRAAARVDISTRASRLRGRSNALTRA